MYNGSFAEKEIDSNNLKSGEKAPSTTKDNYTDENGVKVTVPKDFHVSEEEGEKNVNEGLVIVDEAENEFVWVPVGTLNTKEGDLQTVELGRYVFNLDGTINTNLSKNTGDALKTSSSASYSYTEEDSTDAENGKGQNGNALAKNINEFKSSVSEYGGYYIGRYEAGVKEGTDILKKSDMINEYTAPNENWTGYTGGTLVCQSGKQAWNYVTQNKASELAKEMYENKESEGYISDLVNSYAWDTAIVFIQKFSGDEGYSRQRRLQSTEAKTGEAKSGEEHDVKCNIYDMAGNMYEWTTETYSYSLYPCVIRGGSCGSSDDDTCGRYSSNTTIVGYNNAFRPLLYIKK